jgi:hypothetical protein
LIGRHHNYAASIGNVTFYWQGFSEEFPHLSSNRTYFYPKGFYAWFGIAISLTTGLFKKTPGESLKDMAF